MHEDILAANVDVALTRSKYPLANIHSSIHSACHTS